MTIVQVRELNIHDILSSTYLTNNKSKKRSTIKTLAGFIEFHDTAKINHFELQS